MAMKELFEQHTNDIIEATELLKELSDREGQYVWKKYEPSKTTTVSFAITSTSPVELKVSCADIDLTKVTSSFFVGMKGTYKHNTTNYAYEFTSASAVKMNTSSNSFTYDPTTCTISISVNNSFLVSWSSANTETGLTFLDYVVSDDETAYPDKAEQDGYWYERVSEGVSGIDFGEVTASNASSLSITHNLKVTPKRCILISISQTLASNIVNMIYQSSEVIYSDKYSAAYGGAMYNDWVYKDKCVNATYGATYTSETITFKSPSTTNKFTGTYIWIAIA